MDFLIPHDPLTPRRTLSVDIAPGTRIVRAASLGAWRQAEQAVQAACAQADAIVAGAHDALNAARRQGHAEGTEQARREASQHMAEQIVRTDSYFVQVEDKLVALVMQGVRKIVTGYGDHDRAVHCVRSALAAVRNQKQLTLRVHPGQVEPLKARTGELLRDYPGVDLLDIVPDARMAPDCCVLESDIGVVEAGTQSQLSALEAALCKLRNTPPA